MSEQVEVSKGGVSYMSMSLDRSSKGLEISIKVDPSIEGFMKTMSNGVSENLSAYGMEWITCNNEDPLRLYTLKKDLVSPTYFLGAPDNFRARDNRINLGFLRFVGIGSPQGIKFIVTTPMETSYIKNLSSRFLTETRAFARDYIVPVHVILRISSQDV
jgi:hypothetical protein